MTRHVPSRTERLPGKPEAGAVAVELGLVLPVIVTLVFGIIQFGILFSRTPRLRVQRGPAPASGRSI